MMNTAPYSVIAALYLCLHAVGCTEPIAGPRLPDGLSVEAIEEIEGAAGTRPVWLFSDENLDGLLPHLRRRDAVFSFAGGDGDELLLKHCTPTYGRRYRRTLLSGAPGWKSSHSIQQPSSRSVNWHQLTQSCSSSSSMTQTDGRRTRARFLRVTSERSRQY